MTEPCGSLAELNDALARGEVSSADLVRAACDRAEQLDAKLNAFRSLRRDAAGDEAQASDARRQRGETLSSLDGIPVAIKDNLAQRDEPNGCASRILEGFASPYDAHVVERLREAGAVIIGRTNMDEFAMGSSTEHSAYGATRNPWDLARIPGGSSGGSAAAVAAGVVPLALGSDTGGSIRQPAAHCGVVGMKPTYGRVSRYGLVAFASSLDQVGPFTRNAADCATALRVIAGHDPRESTSLPEPVPNYLESLGGDVSGLVLGLPREYFETEGVEAGVLSCVREAVSELERCGAKVREVSLPHTPHAVATYYLIATAEASSNLARFDGVRYGQRAEQAESLRDLYERSRSEGFGAEVKRRILLGTYVLSAGYYDAYYRKAQQVRTLLRRDFETAFQACDVIVAPTAPEVAFRLGERSEDPLRMYVADIYTASVNLAGIPGLSIPCGFSQDMPVGLQLLGRPLDEATLLRVADAYQARSDWHQRRLAEPS